MNILVRWIGIIVCLLTFSGVGDAASESAKKVDYKELLKLLEGDWKVEHILPNGEKTKGGFIQRQRLSASGYMLVGETVGQIEDCPSLRLFLIYCDVEYKHLVRIDFKQVEYGRNEPFEDVSFAVFDPMRKELQWFYPDGSKQTMWQIGDGTIISTFNTDDGASIKVVQTKIVPPQEEPKAVKDSKVSPEATSIPATRIDRE